MDGPDPEGQPVGMIIPASQCSVVYFCQLTQDWAVWCSRRNHFEELSYMLDIEQVQALGVPSGHLYLLSLSHESRPMCWLLLVHVMAKGSLPVSSTRVCRFGGRYFLFLTPSFWHPEKLLHPSIGSLLHSGLPQREVVPLSTWAF